MILTVNNVVGDGALQATTGISVSFGTGASSST